MCLLENVNASFNGLQIGPAVQFSWYADIKGLQDRAEIWIIDIHKSIKVTWYLNARRTAGTLSLFFCTDAQLKEDRI